MYWEFDVHRLTYLMLKIYKLKLNLLNLEQGIKRIKSLTGVFFFYKKITMSR